ncbi:hypothetical protein NKI48_29740 [Mesorhizobium sp. M0644]|uniref:hypothetical protein n=1 Tax=unclassified Mesorhizobium TaxID=325217 RepID=UPI0033383930
MTGRWQDVEGGVILDSRRRIWGKQFFPSQDGADGTALRCVAPPYTVTPARPVSYFTPNNPRSCNFHVRVDVLVDGGSGRPVPLRDWLDDQGVDADHLKTEPQVLFHGKVPVLQGQDAANCIREILAA